MINIEIEFKTLLNIDEFKRLDSRYQHIKPIHQTNYYIDTPSFALRKERLSLRIRTLSDRAELTLKIPQKVGNMEYNQELELDYAKQLRHQFVLPDGQIREIMTERNSPIDELVILGSLTTRRREFQTPIGLMAIDSNQYAGIKDYELELEVADAKQGEKDFMEFLQQHKINFKYAKSKVARFTATMRSKKGNHKK